MIAPRFFDPSVYFVLDPSVCGGREPLEVARAAIDGGITMLQLRDKNPESREGLVRLAGRLLRMTSQAGIPLMINDWVDVAMEVAADGVHLGQEDAKPDVAREILGPGVIVGQTAFTKDHIAAINPEITDYIGTGPFYETQTKPDKPVLGAAEFERLAALSPVPVVGIGGITPDNASEVIKAGAQGVAMMRSISEADDPREAVRKFFKNKHLGKRAFDE